MEIISEQHAQLWERIKNFSIDKVEDAIPLSKRIAYKNTWTAQKTAERIMGFKEFAFLACTEQLSLAPSRDVDIVWHELYLDSVKYKEFERLIGRSLPHNPSGGGKVDNEKNIEHYQKTIDAHRKYFGQPDKTIWPHQ